MVNRYVAELEHWRRVYQKLYIDSHNVHAKQCEWRAWEVLKALAEERRRLEDTAS